MKLSMMSSVMSSRGFAFDKIVDASIRCGFDGIDVVQEPGLNASDVKKLCADAELPVAGHIFFMPKFLQAIQIGWMTPNAESHSRMRSAHRW
jgi:sugar phosphate isomerase/epimerase